MRTWIINIVVAVNQLINAVLGGSPDESLSSRAYRAELNGTRWGRITRPLIDGIFFLDPNHCRDAFRAELAREQLPEAMRSSCVEVPHGDR